MFLVQYDHVPVDFGPAGMPQRKGEIYGSKVRTVLTEVVNDSNIQYLNPDDDDEPGVQLYVTQVRRQYSTLDFTFRYRHLPRGLAWLSPCLTLSCPQLIIIIRYVFFKVTVLCKSLS